MKTSLIFFMVMLVSLPGLVLAQQTIEKSWDGKYLYDSEKYRSKELKVVFENSGDPLAMDYYNKYINKRKYRKAAIIVTGVALITVPVVYIARDEFVPQCAQCYEPEPSSAGKYIGAGVIATGVTSIIITATKGKKNLDQAIDQFNEVEANSLSIGITGNGVGLSLNF